MKLFISCDMEGISGVAVSKHVVESPDYLRFRKLMTADINAAIAGACAAGVTAVLVTDSHGPMTNILIEELDDRARLISGSNKHFCQMEGLDASFGAAFFIGYHARQAGGDGVLNHTLLGAAVAQIRCNGVEVGEAGINAGLAGHYGVPVGLVSGDDVLAAEVEGLLGPVETAVVKTAINRVTANLLTPARARELIRGAAERAIQRVKSGELQPYRVRGPIEFQVDFKSTDSAHMASIFPVVRRLGPTTVAVAGADYPEAYRMLWGTLILGLKSVGGVLQ